ncbi:LpqB family beta-propeller domain-containing protein [Saccharopolyspora sp. 5N708]|uniref:LpqB family beta-propeller domain-containing protein n=1 Tax=Saccharopolyspora sp. 5N708 TaxID=3457424 RepID=UPI003FD3D6AA
MIRNGRTATTREFGAAATALTATAVLLGGVVTASPSRPASATELGELTQVTVTEGTNLTAAAASDGSVVIDLQGLLFRVPPGGGTAQQLTQPELEPARPDVGPDGRIAFQSYASGQFHIWIADADGTNPVQLTSGGFDDREPRWSPDGSRIAFSSDRAGTYDIWTVDVRTGELTQRTGAPGLEYEPTWHPDGQQIGYVADDHIAAIDAGGAVRTVIPAPTAEQATVHAPAWAPDGQRMAYVQQAGTRADLMVDGQPVTAGEDVFLFTPEWSGANGLLYTADGKIRSRDLDADRPSDIPFEATVGQPAVHYDKKAHDFDDRTPKQVKGILTPALSPDATRVAFVALGDLWLMPIGGQPRKVTDDDFYEVNPAWSADGRYLAYSSDRAGTEDIYLRDVQTGDERRVTALDGAEVSAAFSPDGTRLAYQDQAGATYVLDLGSGGVRELVPPLFGPGRPTWSADGSTIAFAAVKRYSERFREGTSQILTVDVATGQQTFHAPGEEHASISTRGDDGPLWSPNGDRMAFVVDSTLRVMPVDDTGTPTGPARELNGEITDAPSWSGDASELLYLSNGELRLADAATGRARTIDVPLTYRADVAEGRTVIHAGGFWDGNARELRHDVDIVVVGNRIESVTPHRGDHPAGTVVDASGLTVMPGLMDSHVHQEHESRFYGDRQGRISLAYGVTSTMSVGDQVYRAMEDREALTAGDRIGPRFYATGEPIDGSRVYYNFMRPTSSDGQVEFELSRARALDYDMVKTYVRLPANRMKTVIDAAHEMGVPSDSHYLSPGAHLGQDGTTHLAATQRLGYARTLTATGTSYGDVAALYGAGKRSVTATLFTSDFLYGEEMAADPRMALLPPWTRQDLLETTAGNTTPPSDPRCETAECLEVEALGNIAAAGGRVLAGTDSPLTYVAIGLQANLREMVGYGWDEYDALRTATVNAAQNLGVADDVGTLEPGKVADLIMVEGNPLEDIDAAMDVRMTMVGGHLHTREELLAPFTATPPAGGTQALQAAGAPAPATSVAERANPAAASRYWWHAPEIVATDYEHSCDAYLEGPHPTTHPPGGH